MTTESYIPKIEKPTNGHPRPADADELERYGITEGPPSRFSLPRTTSRHADGMPAIMEFWEHGEFGEKCEKCSEITKWIGDWRWCSCGVKKRSSPAAKPSQPPASHSAPVDNTPVTADPSTVPGPVLVRLADVEPRSVQWLWRGRVPLGRITLLVGRPGEGKSFLTLDAAARVSTGSPWPDGAPCERGTVLLISGEDDPHDTIRPRLDAHCADVSRVHLLSMVRRMGEDGKPFDIMFTLRDVAALEDALKKLPDCKLIIVDPIGSVMGGGVDAHRDNEVRSVLAPVAKLAEKYGPAVLVVAHRRKSSGDVADDLALGSRAFTGIARAVHHLSRDPQVKSRRLLLPGKNNLAPDGDGLAFTISGDPAALAWESDPVTMSADEALAVENGDGEEESKPGPEAREAKRATAFLTTLLASGPMPVTTVKSETVAAGLNYRTVQRAGESLGVLSEKSFGIWTWRMIQLDKSPVSPLTEKNLSTYPAVKIPTKTAISTGQRSQLDKKTDSARYGLPDGPRAIAPMTADESAMYGDADDYEQVEREAMQEPGM